MVSLGQLWLPIVLSAVVVFIVSSLLHMVLTYHNADYKPLANEDEVRAVIRKGGATQGQYVIPHCPDMSKMGSPEMVQKFVEGPNGLLILRKAGKPNLGPMLAQWFVYSLLISLAAAVLATHMVSLHAGHSFLFHVIAYIAFIGYAGALPQSAIWRGEPWPATVKAIVDGLIYALVTAETFVLLWPRG
jgi:hypothetical protein